MTNQVLATLKERKQEIRDFPLTAERLADLIAEQKASGLNKQAAEEVYNRMLESGGSAPGSDRPARHQGGGRGGAGAMRAPGHRGQPEGRGGVQEGQDDGGQLVHRRRSCAKRRVANADAVRQMILEELQKA